MASLIGQNILEIKPAAIVIPPSSSLRSSVLLKLEIDYSLRIKEFKEALESNWKSKLVIA